MELSSLIRSILLEDINLQLQQLKDKYVGKGKPLSEKDFKSIEDVSQGKWYLIAWLTKRVVNNLIKTEDIYKWKDYFIVYEKNKKKFQYQDINLYKTQEDLLNLIDKVIEIMEGNIEFEDLTSSEFFLKPKDIQKMEQGGGIKYMGIWKPTKLTKDVSSEGYQVFQITSPTKENWKLYRDMLGRCKGRERGAKIQICTISNYQYFKDYLTRHKGSSYFVLYNLNDPLSPYQLHVESSQFYNKNDRESFNFNVDNFYDWLSSKSTGYDMETIAAGMSLTIPYKDQGYKDDQGKQGKWLTYVDNRPNSVISYVNNRKTGPFVFFDYEGRPQVTGTYKNGITVGKYTELTDDTIPIVDEEGYYDSRGNKIGIWKYKTNLENVSYRLYDFDNHEQFSGTTKNDELIVISDSFKPNVGFFGNLVYYYPSGSIKSQGRKTSTGLMSGKWTFYKPNGEIRAEGIMKLGYPTGIWNIRIPGLTWEGNKNVLFQTQYEDKGFIKKAKVYNSKGEYIGKVKNTDFIIDYIQTILDSQ